MSKENYHKKYRRLQEQNAEPPPVDVWNVISSQLDEDASALHLNKEEQALLNAVWRSLEHELDVDEVWENIDIELHRKRRKALLHKFSPWITAAVILLLIGLSAVMQMLNDETRQPLNAELHPGMKNSNAADTISPDSLVKYAVPDGVIKHVIYNLMPSVNKMQQNNKLLVTEFVNVAEPGVEEMNAAVTQDVSDNPQLPYIEPDAKANELHIPNEERSASTSFPTYASGSFLKPINDVVLKERTAFIMPNHVFRLNPALTLPENKPVDDDWMTAFHVKRPVNKNDVLDYDRKDSRWTTGVVSSVKNTYLLNAETIDGFSPTGMNSAKMTVLPDFGLNVQYAVNKRYILDCNLFFSSTSKQNYNTYSYGEYVSKDLQLNYMAGEFAVKQNAEYSIFGGEKVIRRNVAGVYVAHLKSASETVVSNPQDVASKYAALDYGILMGQEFELRTKGPIKISTGLTVKYGLPNIYAGDGVVPANFNKTHNASVEFRIGIAYRWSAKVGIDHYLGFSP